MAVAVSTVLGLAGDPASAATPLAAAPKTAPKPELRLEKIADTQVLKWKDGKQAVFFLAFDDSCPSHLKNVIPEPRRKESAEGNKGNAGLYLRVLLPPRCKKAVPSCKRLNGYGRDAKSAPTKLALVDRLRNETNLTVRQLAERLLPWAASDIFTA